MNRSSVMSHGGSVRRSSPRRGSAVADGPRTRLDFGCTDRLHRLPCCPLLSAFEGGRLVRARGIEYSGLRGVIRSLQGKLVQRFIFTSMPVATGLQSSTLERVNRTKRLVIIFQPAERTFPPDRRRLSWCSRREPSGSPI